METITFHHRYTTFTWLHSQANRSIPKRLFDPIASIMRSHANEVERIVWAAARAAFNLKDYTFTRREYLSHIVAPWCYLSTSDIISSYISVSFHVRQSELIGITLSATLFLSIFLSMYVISCRVRNILPPRSYERPHTSNAHCKSVVIYLT